MLTPTRRNPRCGFADRRRDAAVVAARRLARLHRRLSDEPAAGARLGGSHAAGGEHSPAPRPAHRRAGQALL